VSAGTVDLNVVVDPRIYALGSTSERVVAIPAV